MNWITFEVPEGGLVTVQPRHVVAMYDEQSAAKPSTTACGVHVPKNATVRRAAVRLRSAA